MTAVTGSRTRRSVVLLYYAYRATTSIGFYLPVGVVFLTEVREFSLQAVGTIMATYLVAMLLAEIPTGYLGDRLGRRASLAIGNTLAASAMIAWPFLETPIHYVAVNVVWATGTACRSGTAGALLYELLDEYDDTSAFARISGRATTVRLVVAASSALAAGALATIDWSLPFLANAALALAGLLILAFLPGTGRSTSSTESAVGEERFTARDAIRMLRVQLARRDVRWFLAYAATFYGLFQLGMAFEQPALRAVDVSVAALGVLYAGFKVVSAGAAWNAGFLRNRLGIRRTFALAAPVVGIVFAAIAVWPIAVVPALFAIRALNAVLRPLRNQYLNDRLGDVGRATVLSGASMVLSLVAAALDVVGGAIAESTGAVLFLAGAGVTAAGVAGILWLAVSPVRDLDEGGSVDDRSDGSSVDDIDDSGVVAQD